jgi:homoserine O-acetyltransferase
LLAKVAKVAKVSPRFRQGFAKISRNFEKNISKMNHFRISRNIGNTLAKIFVLQIDLMFCLLKKIKNKIEFAKIKCKKKTVNSKMSGIDYNLYYCGDIKLQSGDIMKNAQIAYKTFGKMNEDKSNVILYPTWYSGFIADNEWLIGEDMALDPNKYFIIIVALFGNGQSSSPSNNPSYSNCTLYDNVVQQHNLVTKHLGIEKLKLVVGWSMGAQQTYQWAALYPEMVEKIAPFCGSAKTAPHNFVFLEGIKAALLAGNKSEQGIRSFARVYAGWGFSQPFYKYELWHQLGFNSLEQFLTDFWEDFFMKRDADNLLALAWTWQHGNISANTKFKCSLSRALSSIKSKALIMPAEMDLYFPPDDNRDEMKYLSDAEFVVIPGVWGHFAGGGLNEKDTKFIDKQLKNLLNNC